MHIYIKTLLTSFFTLIAAVLLTTQAFAANTTIRMTEQGFEPSTATIEQGDSVEFVNADTKERWPASNIHPSHDVYPEFDPKKGLAPGETWSFTFTKAGTWKFHDHLLPTDGGTIVVKANGSATTQCIGDNTGNTQCSPNSAPGFWARLWQNIVHWWQSLWHKDSATSATKESSGQFDQNIAKDTETIFNDEQALASYVHKYGPKQTIAQLHALESKFGSCHQSAHRAGHIGYQQLGNHALIDYSPECQSGYYHGVMEAYFKDHGTENLSESLNSLCPSDLNNFFEHQCIHGIGHGLLAWTNYELVEALAACDQLPRRQDSCWTGAFMENLSAQIATGNKNNSAESKDTHLTKYLKNDDPLYPCDGVADKYQNSCYFLQTSRMLQMFGTDFSKVAASCATAPAIHQPSCYGSMGRDVGGTFPTDNDAQIRSCKLIADPANRLYCLNGAVQNSFWDMSGETRAIDFCTKLHNPTEKQACYATIIERATQLVTSPAQSQDFCTKIEADYKETCVSLLFHKN